MDQISKYFVIRGLSAADTLPLVPNIFHLTFVRNTGVAFGLFRAHPEWLIWFISASLIVLVVVSLRVAFESKLTRTAFILIIGGALGNWIDRLHYGFVVDFLDFRVWPVFNLADSFITVGVTFYLWHLFLTHHRSES